MIGWGDIYNVVVAVVPLYVALVLGYGSVKWWRIFTAEQCDAINSFVCYFTLPLFTFEFTSHVDPFNMNFMFIAADAISKAVIVAVLGFWAVCGGEDSVAWSISSFSLATLTNALVVGVPMIKPMYGQLGVDLVVQASAVQAIVWLTLLLFVLEFRRSAGDFSSKAAAKDSGGGGDVEFDLEGEGVVEVMNDEPKPFWSLMKVVSLKLATNPNSYACTLGLVWALIANRWNLEMPSVIDGSILIMSKAGTGTAMFNMGLFMAKQKRIISCGKTLTVFGMILRFIGGPAAMAIGAIAVGLRGDVLRIAIIQAAVPQSITSFIFAKEYGLHADVISTAVIFGMIVSLPVLIGYYVILEFLN
ncbi:auxin efflux carrier component 5-like [Malania oleifera]|uniref:auxin efflux carrier component 5-like n=1 Tax=Malania oleifera TaxID=397392 RepID=UPI0025AE8C3A|nr:auxin efflux carrier component 5-like [Malania oleifera]XP_057961860.1 auxin efflux carrier component 5-like [Malania oleifera]